MSTFITRFDTPGPGLRLAVKDLVDMQGEITTAGSRAVADQARPARADAACMAGARAAEARGEVRIVGKTNLHELAAGATGVNPWFGTPVNPLDPERIPGGSSSGSAAAVGADQADIAFGSDTGGSVRIPAACCGVVGLKTTWGRIPLDGVYLLSAELDTIGPMARDVEGVITGMRLLESGFTPAADAAVSVGRLRLPGVDPSVDAAVDDALHRAGFEIEDVELPGWDAASSACVMLICLGAWENDGSLLESHPDLVADAGPVIRTGAGIDADQAAVHRATAQAWRAELDSVLRRVQLIATPTLMGLPTKLSEPDAFMGINTPPVNLAGVPALSLPVPRASGGLLASLQLIGGHRSEELLVTTARRVEEAVSS